MIIENPLLFFGCPYILILIFTYYYLQNDDNMMILVWIFSFKDYIIIFYYGYIISMKSNKNIDSLGERERERGKTFQKLNNKEWKCTAKKRIDKGEKHTNRIKSIEREIEGEKTK